MKINLHSDLPCRLEQDERIYMVGIRFWVFDIVKYQILGPHTSRAIENSLRPTLKFMLDIGGAFKWLAESIIVDDMNDIEKISDLLDEKLKTQTESLTSIFNIKIDKGFNNEEKICVLTQPCDDSYKDSAE